MSGSHDITTVLVDDATGDLRLDLVHVRFAQRTGSHDIGRLARVEVHDPEILVVARHGLAVQHEIGRFGNFNSFFLTHTSPRHS